MSARAIGVNGICRWVWDEVGGTSPIHGRADVFPKQLAYEVRSSADPCRGPERLFRRRSRWGYAHGRVETVDPAPYGADPGSVRPSPGDLVVLDSAPLDEAFIAF